MNSNLNLIRNSLKESERIICLYNNDFTKENIMYTLNFICQSSDLKVCLRSDFPLPFGWEIETSMDNLFLINDFSQIPIEIKNFENIYKKNLVIIGKSCPIFNNVSSLNKNKIYLYPCQIN